MTSFLTEPAYSRLVADLCRTLRMDYLSRRDRENLVAGDLVLCADLWGDERPVVQYVDGLVFLPSREDLIEALSDLEPDRATGVIEPDQIMLSLGEIGDIWPDSAKTDSARLDNLVRLHTVELLWRKSSLK